MIKEIKKKFSAMVVVALLILSVGVIIQVSLTPKVSATFEQAPHNPGVYAFQGWNESFTTDAILNTSSSVLYYMSEELPTDGEGNSYIQVNGSATGWDTSISYSLYYPVYSVTGETTSPTYNLSWVRYGGDSPPQITLPGDDKFGENELSISLNRSGLWLIGPTNNFSPNAANLNVMNSSIAAWFWVNTSREYILSVDDKKFNYDDDGDITITVTKGDDTPNVHLAVYAVSGGRLVDEWNYNVETGDDGIRTIPKNSNYFSHVGDWKVEVYKDLDGGTGVLGTLIQYRGNGTGDGYHYYNSSSYGNTTTIEAPSTDAGWYSFETCGPWDPPEINGTTVETITVETAEPTMKLTNTTLYWGYRAQIDVNITDGDGNGITGSASNIRLYRSRTGLYYTAAQLTGITITESSDANGNYSIIFARKCAGWVTLGGTSGSANGTWYVGFEKDLGGSSDEEWNSSSNSDARFSIKSTSPPVRIEVTGDGDSSPSGTDLKVDIPRGGANSLGQIQINFSIFGSKLTGTREFYGDDTTIENRNNITITGDVLYSPVINYAGAEGNWTAMVTPSKPGGTIIITIDWPGSNNGTDTETINIINGSHAAPLIAEFTVGEETDLTVTVTDMAGDPIKTAEVYLFWYRGGGAINSTTGVPAEVGNGKGGEYTFTMKPSDQGSNAPRNITFAVKYPNGGGAGIDYWGYTSVKMNRNHNMQVNITPTTSYAGNPTVYTIDVTTVGGTEIDTDQTLTVAVYDENGALVTGDDAWSKTNEVSIEDEIILPGGTYYIYAYNATHDSEGRNATITLTKYSVTSDPSVLAWLIDDAQNITFQVTPAVNGTLYLNNVSSTPNASAVGDYGPYEVEITNGIGTITEVNATTLGRITYGVQPETDDGVGENKLADGALLVTTAEATPSPATIYLLEPTTVTITVKHPATGVPLEDIRVSLDNEENTSTTILSKIPNAGYTDANGQITFALTAEASGDVTIYVRNGSDPDNEYVIKAAARKTMTIDVDPSVNEEETFTVTAKSSGVVITDATVTFTFAGDPVTTTTGSATLTAPGVQTNLNYKVTATAPGYTTAEETILIVNQPKIYLTLPDTDASTAENEVTTGSEFEVVAGGDDGNSAGITVTFNGVSKVTSGNGVVKFTAPTDAGEYQVTATKDGYTAATPGTITVKAAGIPGFELLTLLAAIGVAFILLRRRRN